MVAFTTRMPAGIPGNVTRIEHATIESQMLDAANPPTRFGICVKSVSGLYRPLASGDAATDIRGLLVRPFPSGSTNDGLGVSTPDLTRPANVLKSGYVTVLLAAGSAAKDGQVYVHVAAANPRVVGDIVAAAAPVVSVAAAAKAGGNTGNGAISAVSAAATAAAGVYTVRCISAPAAHTATFRVTDPTGRVLGDVGHSTTGGTAVFTGAVGFTITDGATDFVVGDGFDITVTSVTVPVPGAFFMGPAGADGAVEIAYNI